MPEVIMGWTLPALLAGAKTCSRQTWGARGPGTLGAGSLVRVYAGSPLRDRRPGPRTPMAIIRVTDGPALQPLRAMPDSDYDAEGWRCLHEHPEALRSPRITAEDFSWEAFERWRARPGQCWVVRFEVLQVALPLAAAAWPPESLLPASGPDAPTLPRSSARRGTRAA